MKVFVYGTLKQGYGNHRLMIESKGKFLGKDKIVGYACINTRSFPYAEKKDGYKIIGEVYELMSNDLSLLDQLEGYPTHYSRSEVTTKFGLAWVYHLPEPDEELAKEYGIVEEWFGRRYLY